MPKAKNTLTAADILAQLKGKVLTFEALTARPLVKATTLIGLPFTVESASVAQTPFNNGELGEHVELDIIAPNGRVKTTLPVSETSVSIVAYMENDGIEKIENVTFMRQGHTLYLQAIPVPETAPDAPQTVA